MLDTLRFIAVSALGRLQRRPLPPAPCIVSDLPPEILGKIFLCCSEWGSFSTRDAPLLLIQVCRLWREVALSTPSLWSRLPSVWAHPGDGRLRLLELYLEKSAKRALSIAFAPGGSPADAPVLSLIVPYLHQSQRLCIVSLHGVSSREPCITHDHFPLLKNLELPHLSLGDQVLEGQPTIVGLEGMKFPWAQLTQLTIRFNNTIEALVLLRNCSSLEVFRLRTTQHFMVETSRPPPELKTVHRRLRTIVFENLPLSTTGLLAGLLRCLVTPALSTLEFIQADVPWTERYTMESILFFIRNSSAELTSLILDGIRCTLQHLIDLSTLIPMVTELELCGTDLDSFRLLTVKPDSPHGVPFPRLKRLIIRDPADIPFDAKLYANMFHSRLYLAPNTAIIENVSPLQHAELHLHQVDIVYCGIHDFGEQSRWDKSHFGMLVRRLQRVYSKTVDFNRQVSRGATDRSQEISTKVICDINRYLFPARHELGYCSGRLPTGETIRFFRKLDAMFAALEGYHITHALEILENKADRLMHDFSCLPTTAFLHDPTYKFHTRAARLLEQWQPMISEYEAKDRWTCEPGEKMFKLVHRRAVDTYCVSRSRNAAVSYI